MADVLKHVSVGTEYSQAEFEADGRHTIPNGVTDNLVSITASDTLEDSGIAKANVAHKIVDTLAGGDWNWDAGEGLYYGDVDVSDIGVRPYVVQCYFTTTWLKMNPNKIDLSVDADTVRIWMAVNTISLEVACV
jgi:hypothetical protein|tara:strand:- start:521 stop:922 length:402 start_codon:yes stop_codon:yes gene_type:complete